MQLTGEFQHSLDIKGRINFPSKMREILGSAFMICKGLGDPCLSVYSMEEWEILSEKINTLPIARAKRLQRFLFSGAVLAEPDKQGRILIPPNLREYAGLEKELIVAGMGNHAEIWSLERWNIILEEITSEQIEEDLENMGL